jgi:hypothetical protein
MWFFFHKGYIFVLVAFGTVLGGAGSFGSFDSGAAIFGSVVLLILGIVLIILPIVVWLIAISNIIKGHLGKNLENITMIIPYYWYSFFFYLMVNGFNLFLGIMDRTYDNYLFISIAISLLILLIINFLILRLAIKVRKNVTPEYKKVRVAITGASSKRKSRLGIVFNDK